MPDEDTDDQNPAILMANQLRNAPDFPDSAEEIKKSNSKFSDDISIILKRLTKLELKVDDLENELKKMTQEKRK